MEKLVPDAAGLASQDLTEGLGPYFEPVEGFRLEPFWRPEPGPEQPEKIWVAWTYQAKHTGSFAGIQPTGRTVTVRGATLVDWSSGDPLFYRYIDWLDLFQQIGLSMSGRPVVDPAERYAK
jgi:hypothetical protein